VDVLADSAEDTNDFITDYPTNYPGAVVAEDASDQASHDSDVA